MKIGIRLQNIGTNTEKLGPSAMANQYTKQNNKPGRVKYPGHKLIK
jgi:hypothetical protein